MKRFSIPDTLKLIASAGRYFDSSPEVDGDCISFTTRANGNVGDERPGQADINDACALIRSVEAENPNVRGKLSTVDEWTNVDFRAYDRKIPARPPTKTEISKAMELCADLFQEKTTQKDTTVRWSSTGENIFIEWRDPAQHRSAINPHAMLLISVDGHDTSNISDANAKPKPELLEWKLLMRVGRHVEPLKSLSKTDISKSLNSLSEKTDGLKDIFNISYFVEKPGGGYVARNDYQGTSHAVRSQHEAMRIEPWQLEFAGRLSKACGGTIIEHKPGYPDTPLKAEAELSGKTDAQSMGGTGVARVNNRSK